MDVVVKVPEAVVEQLGGPATLAKDMLYCRQLLPGVKNGDRVLVLSNTQRIALQEALDTLLETPDQLVHAVKRLAVLRIGALERNLTQGEAHRLAAYADAHGLSVDEATRQLLEPLMLQFFEAY